MADEYIRKQDAVNVVANTAKIVASFNYQYAIDALLAFTPADVVPVVRCRDCRKCIYDSLFDQLWCNMTPVTRRVKPDDFCSYGERREE